MAIVEERYGRGSPMITSQRPIKAWHDVIGEPTSAEAVLDRIVHNAYRLVLEGQSMRKTMPKTDDEMNQTGFSGDVGVRHSAAILAVSSAL